METEKPLLTISSQNINSLKTKNELITANRKLLLQNEEKEKLANDLIIANKELAFQNEEKEKRAAEFIIAHQELIFQNEEKEKRAAELFIANKELAFQNQEKEKRANELIIANKELAFQNEEKEKRAAEFNIAHKELIFQNEEKEKRAAELIIANKELEFQNKEKGKRADELFIANIELLFQNEEKERRAEELIIAKENAEESDRLKSAFLANMSHEIRTPMNGILGFTELLKEPDLTEEYKRYYIDIIEKSGARLLNTISDIMSISRIESGLMTISISEININEQLEEIHNFFKPEVEQKGIHFYFRNSLPAKAAIIRSDGEKVYAVLTNLVKNAIKFTQSGYIEFGCNSTLQHSGNLSKNQASGNAYSPIDPTGEQGELTFFVKDTGIGIHPGKLELVFDRFRQSNESLNRKYEGTGLGLSISKAYVEMLGGKIWIESEQGKGTTIYFTIPYKVETGKNPINRNLGLNKSHLNGQPALVR